MYNMTDLPKAFRVAPVEDHNLKLLAVVLRGGEAKHAGDVIMGDALEHTCSHHKQMGGSGRGLGDARVAEGGQGCFTGGWQLICPLK